MPRWAELSVGATVSVYAARVMKGGRALVSVDTALEIARVDVSHELPHTRTFGDAVSDATLCVAREMVRVSAGDFNTVVLSVWDAGGSYVMREQSQTGVDTVTTKSMVMPGWEL